MNFKHDDKNLIEKDFNIPKKLEIKLKNYRKTIDKIIYLTLNLFKMIKVLNIN